MLASILKFNLWSVCGCNFYLLMSFPRVS